MDFNWAGCTSLLKRTHSVSLVNARNDCFLNSVLNFVFHTPQLVRYITFKRRKNECSDCNKCVYCILSNYLALIENRSEKINPVEMKEFVDMHFPNRIPDMQEDAHEMLTFLLNQLHNPTLFLATRQKPWVKAPEKQLGTNQLIQGKIASNMFCKSCKVFRSNIPEKFQELNLDLHVVNKQPQDTSRTVDQYIKAYFATEQLSDFKCSNCQEKNVFRKFVLLEAPALLVIQLKRFDSNGKKDLTDIDIPFELDLEEYFEKPHERKRRGKPPAAYKLYGYISHLGESIQSGHYISTFLGYDSEWYLYDDEHVKRTYPSTTSISQQYILFYYRPAVKAPSPQPAHPLLAPLIRPQSSTSQTSARSANIPAQSRHSMNSSRISSVSRATFLESSRTSVGGAWWSFNESSSSPQKRPLNDQKNFYGNSQAGPPSPKRSYNPWAVLTETEYHNSDDDEISRRF